MRINRRLESQIYPEQPVTNLIHLHRCRARSSPTYTKKGRITAALPRKRTNAPSGHNPHVKMNPSASWEDYQRKHDHSRHPQVSMRDSKQVPTQRRDLPDIQNVPRRMFDRHTHRTQPGNLHRHETPNQTQVSEKSSIGVFIRVLPPEGGVHPSQDSKPRTVG